MLGVAAESEFLRPIDVATNSPVYGSRFRSVLSEKYIGAKVKKFQAVLKPIIPELTPKTDFENVETNSAWSSRSSASLATTLGTHLKPQRPDFFGASQFRAAHR